MIAVDDLTSNLPHRGIKRLDLLAENSPSWVVVDLACLDAGVRLIPILHDVKQIANILSQCSADALISDRAVDDKVLTGFLASDGKVQRLNGITSLALWLLPIPLAALPLSSLFENIAGVNAALLR
jgi:long-chain acyl-CoA synthetase